MTLLITPLLKQSIMADRYRLVSPKVIVNTSVYHFRFGSSALKCRWIKLACLILSFRRLTSDNFLLFPCCTRSVFRPTDENDGFHQLDTIHPCFDSRNIFDSQNLHNLVGQFHVYCIPFYLGWVHLIWHKKKSPLTLHSLPIRHKR